MSEIFTIMILYFNILYYKTITIISHPQPTFQVILKADDLKDFSLNVKKLDKIAKKENIKISWGIIGNSLENPDKEYILFLKDNANAQYYHFFNHGYLHLDSKNNEFKGKSEEYQLEHLIKTQELALKKLNIRLNAFGAPNNAIDHNTQKALQKVQNIKYWYYGFPTNNKIIINRSIEVEYNCGNPNYKKFYQNFKIIDKDKKDKIFTLQIHPYMWDNIQFLNFKVIIAYLKSLGCEFIIPDDIKHETYGKIRRLENE